MRKEVVTKTVYISAQDVEFDSEVECLKEEIRYELLSNGYVSDSYDALSVVDYIFNNIGLFNKIVELEKSEAVEAL